MPAVARNGYVHHPLDIGRAQIQEFSYFVHRQSSVAALAAKLHTELHTGLHTDLHTKLQSGSMGQSAP